MIPQFRQNMAHRPRPSERSPGGLNLYPNGGLDLRESPADEFELNIVSGGGS